MRSRVDAFHEDDTLIGITPRLNFLPTASTAKRMRDDLNSDEQLLLDRELRDAGEMLENVELAEASTLYHGKPDPKALN